MAAMLGADAIQMGTAYLATREIIETGALTALYQRHGPGIAPGGNGRFGPVYRPSGAIFEDPKSGSHIIPGEGVCSGPTRTRTLSAKRMEEMTAGSLFTAARGMDRPGGVALDEQGCLERGQFMSGTCAGLIIRFGNCSPFTTSWPKVLSCCISPLWGRSEKPGPLPRSHLRNSIHRGRPWNEAGRSASETTMKGLPSPG